MKVKLLPPAGLLPGEGMGLDDDLLRACCFPIADQLDHADMEYQVVPNCCITFLWQGSSPEYIFERDNERRIEEITVGQIELKAD